MVLEETARHASGLGSGFRGRVIAPGADDYDRARRVHNAAVDRHPALIVRLTDADAVALVVAHAQEQGLPAGRPSWRPQHKPFLEALRGR